MGMDQMALSREKDFKGNNPNSIFSNDAPPFHVWRENEYLDMFFEHLWQSQDSNNVGEEFNGVEVEVTLEVLSELETLINTDQLFKGVPSDWYNAEFYTRENYLKEYPQFKSEDLLFIEKARQEIAKGQKVIYINWK